MRFLPAALLILVLFASLSVAQPLPAARIDAALASAARAADADDLIPVVIRYREGYTHGDAGDAGGVYAAMGPGFEVRREYHEMNAVSGRVSKSAFYALKKNPNVAAVDYDHPVHAFLQDVLPLINASRTHNATAGGLPVNGFGETVCIIDTGINYTHPDLGGCSATSDINDGSCAKAVGGYNYCADDACSTENSNPMDNEGHGTHVSGIAAANGTIRGVAPGARIVMMKALNSTGSGSFADIEAAIRWCTANATRLNITIISMSLGTTTTYTSACDSDYLTLADAINNATRNNITVLAASGNSGSTTGISSPACIANVTAVTSSTKTDGVSSFSNRNALVNIIAPGSSVNSTNITGGYSAKSGTSMAAPAAAGAFALARAYERQESGTNLTPASLFTAINSTGIAIFDSGSNRTYMRVNVIAAVTSLDNTKPSAAIASPANATFGTLNTTLNFTISDNIATGTCWYLNATGANVSLPSCGNITFSASEGYSNITVFVNDTRGNTNSTQRFFTADTTAPAVGITSPANTTYTTNNITLNFTGSDARIGTCFYSLNGAANVTLAGCGNLTFLAAPGDNNLTVYANDTAGNLNSSAVRFSVNISAPILTIQSPQNRTYAALPALNYTAVDNNLASCWYVVNGGANTSLANCTNASSVGAEGQNVLTLYANDTAGNQSSAAVNFTVDTNKPSIAIQSPANRTYNVTNLTLNFTMTDNNTQSCWYFNSTGGNISLASCGNITFAAAEGVNNITAFANDTAGNTNSTQINFTIDLSPPSLAVSSPQNTTYSTANITLNYTTGGNVDRCWFINSTGATVFLNTGTGATCANITFLAAEGQNNITVRVNDTGGNLNSTQIFFVSDTIKPAITFTPPTPNNEFINTTFHVTVNATINDNVSAARVNFNGTFYSMALSGGSWSARIENLTDGNYTFNVTANDTANNTNTSESRWVYINATRNVASFSSSLNSTLGPRNITYAILNGTGEVTNNIIDVVRNYTLQFNVTGRLVEILNFTWLSANTSAVVNVTTNVSTENLTTAFSSSGGALDTVVWVDMNNFTTGFVPRALFPRNLVIFYYVNGTRAEPNYTRITTQCDAGRSSVPCYERNATHSTVYLQNFSGAAAGNDTQKPNISISSPASAEYSTTNITLNYTLTENVGVDKCWYILNSGSNTTLPGCGNITFTAPEGTSRLYVYANDTSGNQNVSNVNFTVTLPASSGSGGGGGGGGGAAATAGTSATKQTFSFSGAGTIRLSLNPNKTAVTTIFIETAGQMSASLTLDRINATALLSAPGITYEVLNITAAGFTPAFRSATLHFSVPKLWLAGNSVNVSAVRLYRLETGQWQALETALIREDPANYTYSAATANFSLFAIAGEPARKTEFQEPAACIQVITPATNGTHCAEYSTPCDVPAGWTKAESCQPQKPQEPQPAPQGSGLAYFIVLVLALAGAVAYIAYRASRKSVAFIGR